MEIELPSYLEDDVSQVPALQLLINMGWEYLSPEEAIAARGGKRSRVILEDILTKQLKVFNNFTYKGQVYPFSETNIANAVRVLRDLRFEGLIKTNQEAYDLLTYGKSLEETIDGATRSPQLQYIDWNNPKNNVYHVTEEFSVERTGSHETRRPDIILFVNGIPLVVIECKRPDLKKDPIDEAVNQHSRNQHADEIPHLFYYSQILLALCTNQARYGTTGTERKYWSSWQSQVDEELLNKLINTPLSDELKGKLFSHKYRPESKAKKKYFDELEASGPRLITDQDRCLFGLLDKTKLLDYMFRSIVYDAGVKKVARYNQDRLVAKTLERVHQREDGRRKGGVIWHTQGSGKSLSMVLIAKALALDPQIHDPRIILVTDRTDLDNQLRDNFKNCGLEVIQAKKGSHLLELIESEKHQVIITIINKFKAALKKRNFKNESSDIFVLIDESHRTQHGSFHSSMRKILPNACYLGFTGTPLIKKEKNDIDLFGGFIDTYTIDDALRDKVVCPLLYEGRYVEQDVNQATMQPRGRQHRPPSVVGEDRHCAAGAEEEKPLHAR
jgi:type I restriction enzyme R subunit